MKLLAALLHLATLLPQCHSAPIQSQHLKRQADAPLPNDTYYDLLWYINKRRYKKSRDPDLQLTMSNDLNARAQVLAQLKCSGQCSDDGPTVDGEGFATVCDAEFAAAWAAWAKDSDTMKLVAQPALTKCGIGRCGNTWVLALE